MRKLFIPFLLIALLLSACNPEAPRAEDGMSTITVKVMEIMAKAAIGPAGDNGNMLTASPTHYRVYLYKVDTETAVTTDALMDSGYVEKGSSFTFTSVPTGYWYKVKVEAYVDKTGNGGMLTDDDVILMAEAESEAMLVTGSSTTISVTLDRYVKTTGTVEITLTDTESFPSKKGYGAKLIALGGNGSSVSFENDMVFDNRNYKITATVSAAPGSYLLDVNVRNLSSGSNDIRTATAIVNVLPGMTTTVSVPLVHSGEKPEGGIIIDNESGSIITAQVVWRINTGALHFAMEDTTGYTPMLFINGSPSEAKPDNVNFLDGRPGWSYRDLNLTSSASLMLILRDGTPYGVGVYTVEYDPSGDHSEFTPMTAAGGTV